MKMKMKATVLGVIATAVLGVAIAGNDDPWENSQRILAGGSEPIGNYGLRHIYFSIHEFGPNWNSVYSSRVVARAWTRADQYPHQYTHHYSCQINDLKQSEVSRIADDSSSIGSNRAWSYTLNAPACNGYPAATFTVQCDANEMYHVSRSSGYKQTMADGTKRFYSSESERLVAEHNNNVGDTTCKITFDNGTMTIVNEYGYADVYDERRREK